MFVDASENFMISPKIGVWGGNIKISTTLVTSIELYFLFKVFIKESVYNKLEVSMCVPYPKWRPVQVDHSSNFERLPFWTG